MKLYGNLTKFTPAEGMIHYRGIGYAKKYLTREPGVTLLVCSAGHPDCAHYKKGPCMVEMKALIKAHNAPKETHFIIDPASWSKPDGKGGWTPVAKGA